MSQNAQHSYIRALHINARSAQSQKLLCKYHSCLLAENFGNVENLSKKKSSLKIRELLLHVFVVSQSTPPSSPLLPHCKFSSQLPLASSACQTHSPVLGYRLLSLASLVGLCILQKEALAAVSFPEHKCLTFKNCCPSVVSGAWSLQRTWSQTLRHSSAMIAMARK